MRRLLTFMLLCLMFPLSPSFAEDDIFGMDTDVFLDNEDDDKKAAEPQYIASFLKDKLPESMTYNISKAEKVFCYTVDYAAKDYEGYYVHGMALKGSCGELSSGGKDLIKSALFNNNAVFSNNSDKCNINPKILLRYVHGIDYTDVLISAPCHSLTFFHDNDIKTVNAAPGKDIIEQIVKAYSGLQEKFLSPALLGQMVANGQILTQTQKDLVRRMAPTEAPAKKWNSAKPAAAAQQTDAPAQKQPARSGWNKLR